MPLNDPIAQPETADAGPVIPPAPVRPGRWAGLRLGASGVVRAHRPFTIVVIAAALLRLIVMLGYPPAMFFNDSFNYLTDAYTKTPDLVRSDGYPLFLYLLLPFHSLNVVTGLQALMGLAMGVGIYAVLRRRGLPWWGATIPALPVLFDVFELQLEHMIAADVLFYTICHAGAGAAVLVGQAAAVGRGARRPGDRVRDHRPDGGGAAAGAGGDRHAAAEDGLASRCRYLCRGGAADPGVRDLVPLVHRALRARRVERDLPLQPRAVLRRLQPDGPLGQAARALRPARPGGPPVVPGVPLVRRHAAGGADRERTTSTGSPRRSTR